ncbi:MAG: histidine--tRNA ligase [Deferribacterales bacterium]
MFSKVKGFRDIYGDEIRYWKKFEDIFTEVFNKYDYQEFKLPILEKVELFKRGIGDTTDIVEKEMFVFKDRGGEKLALRPEGTASLVRGYIENKIYTQGLISKYYYYGPMFRRERPQKGRFRQFYQAGVEVFGSNLPIVDAEVIKTMYEILISCGIGDIITLNINSLGCPICRPAYKDKLISFLSSQKDHLCSDCNNRLEKNPLRVLDCKVDRCKSAVSNAPLMVDHLCSDCNEHFKQVKKFLLHFNVNYNINPYMVRGLDYYVRTAFEFNTEFLGASNAVGGGGRYDGLIKTLGGPDIPGIGYAIGADRVVTLMMEKNIIPDLPTKISVIFFNETFEEGFKLLDLLRSQSYTAIYDYEMGSFKNQFKKADRSGSRLAVIIGTDEKEKGVYKVKDLITGNQIEVEQTKLLEEINKIIRK